MLMSLPCSLTASSIETVPMKYEPMGWPVVSVMPVQPTALVKPAAEACGAVTSAVSAPPQSSCTISHARRRPGRV